ncbi:hypothetical protein ACFLYU_02715 [Candidatus Dependentiae bacterium]
MFFKILAILATGGFLINFFTPNSDKLDPKEIKIKVMEYSKKNNTITCMTNHPLFNRLGKRVNKKTQKTTMVKNLDLENYNKETITKNPDNGRIEGQFLDCDSEYLLKKKIDNFEKELKFSKHLIKLKEKNKKHFPKKLKKNKGFKDLKIYTQIYTKK